MPRLPEIATVRLARVQVSVPWVRGLAGEAGESADDGGLERFDERVAGARPALEDLSFTVVHGP